MTNITHMQGNQESTLIPKNARFLREEKAKSLKRKISNLTHKIHVVVDKENQRVRERTKCIEESEQIRRIKREIEENEMIILKHTQAMNILKSSLTNHIIEIEEEYDRINPSHEEELQKLSAESNNVLVQAQQSANLWNLYNIPDFNENLQELNRLKAEIPMNTMDSMSYNPSVTITGLSPMTQSATTEGAIIFK